MSSLQSLIHLFEGETQGDILKLLKKDTADIRRMLHRAKSIRSYQGVDSDQSSFHFTHQSITSCGVDPSCEAQLA